MVDPDALIPSVTPRDALRLAAREGAVIVDVREADELARTGKLAGARHLPLRDVPERAAAELPRDRPILLYCAAGIRSAMAGRLLRAMGWEHVFNLGGLADAAAAGMPIEWTDLDS